MTASSHNKCYAQSHTYKQVTHNKQKMNWKNLCFNEGVLEVIL